ncbi:MAG: hypothetical protein WD048_14495 [Chitinophagales bacterium]
MFLLAESGSTKADWLLISKGKVVKEFSTNGLSPLYHDTLSIGVELSKIEDIALFKNQILKIQFYGAWCSNKERNAIIEKGLSAFFRNAAVNVQHDLLASVYATCGDQPGISCILGTGSNACYYDGEKLDEGTPSLGYILGDEGGASQIGRDLIRLYFYDRIPKWLKLRIYKEFDLDREKLLDEVYLKPKNPNQYLAQFTRVLGDRQEDPFVQQLLKKSFNDFLDFHVLPFKKAKEVPVHFVGSIAFIFKNILLECLNEKGLQVGKVIRKPIYDLALYHIKKGEA